MQKIEDFLTLIVDGRPTKEKIDEEVDNIVEELNIISSKKKSKV
jgi:hypothetical protein